MLNCDRRSYVRPALAGVLLCLLVGDVRGENCGNFACPSGFTGVAFPATVVCSEAGAPVCSVSVCCEELVCGSDASSLLAANNVANVADLSACNAVSEGGCTSTCLTGFTSTGTPTITCVAASTYAVTSPCSLVTCPSTWTDGPALNIQTPSAALLATCDDALASACTLSCAAGFDGSPTLSCLATGAYAVAGSCAEQSCGGFALTAGMVQGALTTKCALTSNTVQPGTLKPVTQNQCTLACDSGYVQGGSQVLACAAGQLTPVTTMTCTENACAEYTVSAGMIAGATDPCTISSGKVSVLRPISDNSCTLACASGYSTANSAPLRCSTVALTPTTTLTCTALSCTLGATAVTHTTVGLTITQATDAVVSVGTNAATDVLVIDAGHHCTGTPTALCTAGGASQYTVQGLTCQPIQCSTAFTAFSTHNVLTTSTTSCNTATSAGCVLSCATGYKQGAGVPTLSCSGTAAFGAVVGTWTVTNPCIPIPCSAASAAAIAATSHVTLPSSLAACDTVPESTCILVCDDGYTTGVGSPVLKCTAEDTYEITNHCRAKCALSAGVQVNGGTVASGLTSPTTTTCAAGSGFVLRPAASSISCALPPTGLPADPSRDCSVGTCCIITCGFAPCSASAGFTLKTLANTISCTGAEASTCSDTVCCDSKTCNPVNAPSVSGAVLSCTGFSAHGQNCTVAANQGYQCSGTVACTAASSDTGTYINTASCSLATCPANANTPPLCTCNPGYDGVPSWGGVSWLHQCTAQQCRCTTIANSESFSGANSLCGSTGTTVAVVCNSGYTPSVATTTCDGGTLLFSALTCDARTCTASRVLNSVSFEALSSITGSTGTAVAVSCKDGFVGTGAGCPDACSATCDGFSFNSIVCNAVACPDNSGPPGLCTCNSGYSGTPVWSAAAHAWTHTCSATCGLYTCSSAAFTLLTPPNNFLCGSSLTDCTDATCCRGGAVTPTTLTTSEDGTQVHFTITLVSKPNSFVSVPLTSSNTLEVRVLATSVTFTTDNWNIPKTVTVEGVPDNADDGDQTATVTTGSCVSADTNYNGLNLADVTVTNLDQDTRGVHVNPRVVATSETGTQGIFTVVLTTVPTADVTVPVVVDNTAEGTVSTASLTFTTANWNVNQTVVITGLDDQVNDGDVTYRVLLGAATSADLNYNQLPVPYVSVTNLDNDASGIVVTATTALQTTEQGGTAAFTVVLTSQPTADVAIPISSSDVTEGVPSAARLIFTASNWNVPQTVLVSGVQDNVADGDVVYRVVTGQTVTADASYAGLDAEDVTLTNTDDDSVGYTVTPASGLATSETGGSTSFALALTSEPLADVTVTAVPNNAQVSVSPSTVTFTPANYSSIQVVLVAGQNDYIANGNQDFIISFESVSGDAAYARNVPPPITGTNTDNDVAGVILSQNTTMLTTTEAGGSAVFTLELRSLPTSPVTLTMAGDSTEGLISPSAVTFNSRNWNVSQLVTVTGLDDLIDDGDVIFEVRTTATSLDSSYNGFAVPDVSVKNIDDDVRGVTVTPSVGLFTTEYGGAATFTVVLDTQPQGDVTIALRSSFETEGVVSPTSLTFSPVNWMLPRPVTVSGVQDVVKDGDTLYNIVFAVTSPNDAAYQGLNVGLVSVTNLDDDTPGIIVNPEAGLVTYESGGTSAHFTVRLRSTPTSTVTVPFTADSTEGTLTPSSVQFTPNDWSTPKTVTVTGVDDEIVDGNISYYITCGRAESSDATYSALVGPDVAVVNVDNDAAGLLISPEGLVVTTEAGGEAQVNLVLASRPTAEVHVLLTGDNTEVSFNPATVTFTAANYNAAQTVTIVGVDDDFVDGNVNHTIIVSTDLSLDPLYKVLQPLLLPGANMDNDTAGVWLSKTELLVSENGSTDSFTVKLASRPYQPVSITVTSGDVLEGVVSPAVLTFVPAEWDVPQSVVVTGVDDSVDDGSQEWTVLLQVDSVDADYLPLAGPSVTVVTEDDDTAGMVVSPLQGLATTEAGGTATYTMRLTTRPAAEVQLSLVSGQPEEGSVSPTSLAFTAANWDVPRTITITGVDDDVNDGNVSYVVSANPASSADQRYDGYQAASVHVVNLDNDRADVLVSPRAGLVTTEGGGEAFFTLSLNSQPMSGVSIAVESNDTTEGRVGSLFMFSPSNWNVLQNVTIVGVDDPLDDGNVPYLIRITSVTSADARYAALEPGNVSVVNVDNDTPGVTVAPTSGLVVSEDGGTAHFVVLLNSKPEADVTVRTQSNLVSEGTIDQTQLIFTPSTWDTQRTVTVTGVDDAVDDGDMAFVVELSSAESRDVKYNRLDVENVAVTNMDDDTAAIVVDPTADLETNENGATAHFSVKLGTEPVGDVTMTVSSSNFTECSVSPLRLAFSRTNWSEEVTVTVTGIDDDVDDGDRVVTIATGAAISTDAKYDGMNAVDVTVTNRDNDTAGVTLTPRSGLTTAENGTTAQFTVVLNSRPTDDVSITMHSSNTTEGTVSPSTLTFIPSFWNVQQTVTVTGVDDDMYDGNRVYFIETDRTSSNDALYHNIDVADVQVANIDDDVASVLVTPTEGLVVSEDGSETARVEVVLTSRPAADVTIHVLSLNEHEGSVATDTLVFTPFNWNAAAEVVVHGVDDNVRDGDTGFIVHFSAAISADDAYSGFDPPDVLVMNKDNDVVGLVVNPTELLTAEDENTTLSVKLSSEPTAGVLVEVRSSDSTEVTVSPADVLFTRDNWNTTVDVVLHGVYDNVVDGNRYFTITLAVVTEDPHYSLLGVTKIDGINRDMLNECYSDTQTCAAAGQACNDTERGVSSTRDYTCTCTGAASGSARGTPATCTYTDDCTFNGDSCRAAGQQCVDPDVTRSDDWFCDCVPPHVRVNTTDRVAQCILDECTTVGTACEAAGQECEDADTSPSSLGDWTCTCKAPKTGSALARIATCSPSGECTAQSTSCGTDQYCLDPSDSVLGDWMCVCEEPFQGTMTRGQPQCSLDECTLYSNICNEVGQTCTDPNVLQVGDWTCQCIGLRITGVATAMSAQCTLDECVGNTVCISAGQVCRDRNTAQLSLDDWVCECVAPAVGSAATSAASCVYAGECAALSSVCTDAGQTCYDPSFTRIGDWQCRCVSPYEFHYDVGQPATCVYDECSIHSDVCASAGQVCYDPNTDPNSSDDWRCECVSPSVGSATASVSHCSYVGECTTYHGVCEAAGQACYDPTDNVDDWGCKCIGDKAGTRAGAPAVCELDECIEHAKVCASSGQLCEDPNTSLASRFDWRCQCVEPAVGSARARPAACVYERECQQHALTCTSAGQTCSDTSDNSDSWECVCLTPATGRATTRSASCYYSECSEMSQVCTDHDQTCEDPNSDPNSLGDWLCRCTGGESVGSRVGGVATCIQDECIQYGTTCTSVGQLCKDYDTSPSSLGDWHCECVSPATGTRQEAAATCTYSGTCTVESSICTNAGQSCRDETSGGFSCNCLWPQTGSENSGPATCWLDECDIHADTCLSKGQECVDTNTDTGSLDTWVCQCKGSGSGSAKAGVASCTFEGECALRSQICTVAGQTCVDPSQSSDGDWECLCVPPYTGTATGGVAVCVLDECNQYGHICTKAGQRCTDPDTRATAKDDWTCTCIGSAASGSAVAKVAVCTHNECNAMGGECTSKGQLCEDPDQSPSSTDDWRCLCVAPATGQRSRAAATCAHVGECVRFEHVCSAAGQSCTDTETSTAGDWECNCLKPYVGTARGRAAVCKVDECVLHGSVCRDAGQICRDPSDSMGDWTCDCVLPSTGQGIQEVAVCVYQGECKTHASTCSAVGQACADPDTTRAQDWQCICPSPLVGVMTAGVAVCKLDECLLYSATCTGAGQLCHDPNTNPSSTDDWQCSCTESASGFATASSAQCFHHGECSIHHSTCTSVGQACYDPNPSKNGDWECICVAPQNGKGLQRAAHCTQDECTQFGSICSVAVQSCVDPNISPTSVGDWECRCLGSSTGAAVATAAVCQFTDMCVQTGHVCHSEGQACVAASSTRSTDWHCECVPPYSGRRFMGKATCTLDECTAHGAICSNRGQICQDPNTSPDSIGDWTCECVPPATGSARAEVASCVFSGECITQSSVCTSSGQTCQDPQEAKTNDWQCVCVAPSVGVATGKAATCEIDECIQHGDICQSVGQLCHDPNPLGSNLGDWMCRCVGSSATGTSVGKAATCVLDECATSGQVCLTVGQECHDPNIDPESTGDWVCWCPNTSPKQQQQAGVATCTNYEGMCSSQGTICSTAGQYCSDEVNATTWSCHCPDPHMGNASSEAATCTYDECETHGDVCEMANQRCVDKKTDISSTGDWSCVCNAPLEGSATARAAVCAYMGECTANAIVCTMTGQDCYDPSPTTDDWMCICREPNTGVPGTRAPASCELDECRVHGDICRENGQVCVDSDKSLTSTRDWVCACLPPATGHAVASAASCEYFGECVDVFATCTEAGQSCIDPTEQANDWECQCTPPFQGRSTGGPASCTYDECITHTATCAEAGQLCVDPKPTQSSVDDWRCECIAPAIGVGIGKAAVCTNQGECSSNGATCAAAGQTCVDPDVNMQHDWECVCISPQVGSARGAVAACYYDECLANGNVCTDKLQICHDMVPSMDSLNDWECSCTAPSVGSAVMAPATCMTDECQQHGSTCGASGQTCHDSDRTTPNNWMCGCIAPQSGTATGAVASCDYNECSVNAGSCTVVGQLCDDPNTSPSSLGDWTCNCQASGEGSATAQAATCVYTGECIEKASVCTGSGQACSDPNTNTPDDWECICIAPLSGTASLSVATCTYDECQTKGNICTDAGQICRDDNTGITGTDNWSCICPTTGATSKAGVAVCKHDECVVNGKTCLEVGQQCFDPNTNPQVLGDWICKCTGSSTGSAVGRASACEYQGECHTNAAICTLAGQTCHDPDISKTGDWVCMCALPSSGASQVAGPAHCAYDECSVGGGRECLASGQKCVDVVPLSTSLADWICECTGTSTGIATAAVAVCNYTAECVVQGPSCANTGRTCVDPDPLVSGNARCECASPSRQSTTTDSCVVDECQLYGTVCSREGQGCNDPDQSALSLGDWTCTCIRANEKGTGTAQPATCTVDECYGNAVCSDAGQVCKDTNSSSSSRGDWSCVCQGAGSGQALASVAVCSYTGECKAISSTCTAVGQVCSNFEGGWECGCLSPLFGKAKSNAAACRLDECTTHWKVCAEAGQRCEDVNTATTSKGDWRCVCTGSSQGYAVAQKATCAHFGGCAKHEATCTDKGMSCVDNAVNSNDWECGCVSPQVYMTEGGRAGCFLDECALYKMVCNAAGQTCHDPSSAEGDWTCLCVAPSKGYATAKAAVCTEYAECATHADVCTSSGQSCYDQTGLEVLGDWGCACIEPFTGKAGRAAAVCTLDECVQHGSVCNAQGQTCHDLNPAATSLGDWRCTCPGMQSVSAVAKPAVCLLDECIALDRSAVCAAAGQHCVDLNLSPSALGDWMCQCIGGVGRAVASAAQCVFIGECADHAATCTNAGQTCTDPSDAADDWSCLCVNPAAQVGTDGKLSVCEVDECKAHGTTCSDAGQECEDPNIAGNSLSDWKCLCPGASTGEATAQQAECRFNSTCSGNGVVCTASGQQCIEAGESWECGCVAPATGATTREGATRCSVDECLLHGAVCTSKGQTCSDQSQYDSLDDWLCTCEGSGEGAARAKAAVCEYEPLTQCSVHAHECEAAGQACKDTDGSWMCVCPAPLSGSAVGGIAVCEDLGECFLYAKNCTDQGQTCEDPSRVSNGDWRCVCPAPKVGSAQAAPATCASFVENTAKILVLLENAYDDVVAREADLREAIRKAYGLDSGEVFGRRMRFFTRMAAGGSKDTLLAEFITALNTDSDRTGPDTAPTVHAGEGNVRLVSWLAVDSSSTRVASILATPTNAASQVEVEFVGGSEEEREAWLQAAAVSTAELTSAPGVQLINENVTVHNTTPDVVHIASSAVDSVNDTHTRVGLRFAQRSLVSSSLTNTLNARSSPEQVSSTLSDANFAPVSSVLSTSDCGDAACTDQTCTDTDGTADGAFTCTCISPASGTAQNGEAVCTTPAPDTNAPEVAAAEDDSDDDVAGMARLTGILVFCAIGCVVCVLFVVMVYLCVSKPSGGHKDPIAEDKDDFDKDRAVSVVPVDEPTAYPVKMAPPLREGEDLTVQGQYVPGSGSRNFRDEAGSGAVHNFRDDPVLNHRQVTPNRDPYRGAGDTSFMTPHDKSHRTHFGSATVDPDFAPSGPFVPPIIPTTTALNPLQSIPAANPLQEIAPNTTGWV